MGKFTYPKIAFVKIMTAIKRFNCSANSLETDIITFSVVTINYWFLVFRMRIKVDEIDTNRISNYQ